MPLPAPRLARLDSPAAGIELAWCPVDCSAAEEAAWSSWLSEGEHARTRRFGRAGLRTRYIAGRAALRYLLAERLGASPEAIAIVRAERGRPFLAPGQGAIDFNVSHTAGVAVFALASTVDSRRRVGIDIEHRERAPNVRRLVQRVATESERGWLETLAADAQRLSFLELWTCKEAMSKASGQGLAAPFGRIEVRLQPVPELVAGPSPYVPAAWTLHRVHGVPGCIVTLALWQRPVL